jgi:four helix bundle protein
MAKGDNIQERLINFAVAIIKLCSLLPKNPTGNHIADQLLRSGTSPAPNYGEARGAESRRDFVHKLGIVLKELNETEIWLEVIKRSELFGLEKVQPVTMECKELCRIIGASIRTTGKSKK